MLKKKKKYLAILALVIGGGLSVSAVSCLNESMKKVAGATLREEVVFHKDFENPDKEDEISKVDIEIKMDDEFIDMESGVGVRVDKEPIEIKNELKDDSFVGFFIRKNSGNMKPITVLKNEKLELEVRPNSMVINCNGKKKVYDLKLEDMNIRHIGLNIGTEGKLDVFIDGKKKNEIYKEDFVEIDNVENEDTGVEVGVDNLIVARSKLKKGAIDLLSKSVRIPTMYLKNNGSERKITWGVDIADSDVIWSTGYEKGQQGSAGADLLFNPNNGMGNGGQYFSSTAKAGSYSLATPKTKPDKGNSDWNGFNKTADNHIWYRGRDVGIPNGTDMSATFSVKSGSTGIVRLFSNWIYVDEFLYYHPDVTYAQDYPVGTRELKVKGVGHLKLGNPITTDQYANVHKQNTDIKELNASTGVIKLGAPTKYAVKKGDRVKKRNHSYMFSLNDVDFSGNNNWNIYSTNGKVSNPAGVNWQSKPQMLRQKWQTDGTAYMDELKVGKATTVRVFRNGTQIYRGKGSEYVDKTTLTDTSKPNKVDANGISTNIVMEDSVRRVHMNFREVQDNGTEYKYQLSAVASNGAESARTPGQSVYVTSGMAGYSYVVDDKSGTIPDGKVDVGSGGGISFDIPKQGSRYIHIRAIDNAGNAGDTTHLNISGPSLTGKVNGSDDSISLSWGTGNGWTSFDVYRKEKTGGYKHINSNSNASYKDAAANDRSAPGTVSATLGTADERGLLVNARKPADYGTEYTYYLKTHSRYNGSTASNPVTLNLVSGVKGYSYSITKNKATVDASVESTVDSFKVVVDSIDDNWLNIAAVDYAGNIGQTIHVDISGAVPKTPPINGGISSWVNTDVKLSVDKKNPSGSRYPIANIDYRINNGTWQRYSNGINLTQSGTYKVDIRAIDTRGVVGGIITKTIYIDKEKPAYDVSGQPVVDDRSIALGVNGAIDRYSGIKNIWVSNTSDFASKENFNMGNIANYNFKYILPKLKTEDENYSTRTVYVRMFDVAGNSTDKQIRIKVEPKAPNVPLILSLEESDLFVTREIIPVKWQYSDPNVDFGAFEQFKSCIEFRNLETGEKIIKEYKGEEIQHSVSGLPDGVYSVKLTVWNRKMKSRDSKEIKIRVNRFNEKGVITTKKIISDKPLKILRFKTEYELPGEAEITAKIYYKKLANGEMDKSKYIEIDIVGKDKNEYIGLPEKSNELIIEYNLKGSDKRGDLMAKAPYLDRITVYGR